ncbi:S8 family peptidase [Microbacterium sp. Marseille-Q6648]|uniref:S8 family peptidase n=1 Tax=Microbacterium sp. Marseille-Q6648 TaxID=2937991 RepID=UPI0020418DB2|nr:S8 family peptidase [Microbacterium sp. Marseille-Q6648]
MPNEPVQVVTNPHRLRTPREKNRPGKAGDDFFAGDDTGFAAHRDFLAASLRDVISTVRSAAWQRENGDAVHIRVTMRLRAIAKSHRPQRAVFREKIAPHVATARIGEPIYAVTAAALERIADLVATAPTEVPTKTDKATSEVKPNPTRLRCELSAIAAIELWTAADKRSFSAVEGAEWLSRAGTGGQYIVNFFPLAGYGAEPNLIAAEQVAARALHTRLSRLAVDARARAALGRGSGRVVTVGLLDEGRDSVLQLGLLATAVGSHVGSAVLRTASADRHEAVLRALEESTLVRDITLPPIAQADKAKTIPTNELLAPGLPDRGDEVVARVGVIDGGVSQTADAWVIDRWDQLSSEDRDEAHGTFISGLLVACGDLNPHYLSSVPSGCEVVDIDVLPADPAGTNQAFERYYPNGVIDFLDEVESAVSDYRSRLGVRVFNFSLNFVGPGDSARYGYAARRLDQIARDHDVIFVISAGNLAPAEQRSEWPSDTAAAVATLIGDSTGLINEPAESLFNLSVSALNPPDLNGQVPYALARYSRRGPGLRGATKPDFAHVGGSGTPDSRRGHGLMSIDVDGVQTTGAGTSYAAPLVARVLADLDQSIDGNVPREVLLALLVHYAQMPAIMRHRNVLPLARDLAGYGLPSSAAAMLQRPDSEIVIVVHSTVLSGEQHTLDFNWPAALVDPSGKCRGYARLTLVARPVLAYEHGDERVRVNIDAKLMQQQEDGPDGDPRFKNALKPVNRPAALKAPRNERELLQEASKWQVVKSFETPRMRGRGIRSDWRFLVEYLTRAEEQFPDAGVEFAAVLTIADDQGDAPVFQQMRQHLGDLGVRTGDIRTSIRTRIQGGAI